MDNFHLNNLLDLNKELSRLILKNPSGERIFDDLINQIESVFNSTDKSKNILSSECIKLAAAGIRCSVVGNIGDNNCLHNKVENDHLPNHGDE